MKILRILAAAVALTWSLRAPAFTEAADPAPADPAAWTAVKSVTLGWGSTDVRYSRSVPAAVSAKAVCLDAWRGERVSAQAVLSTPRKLQSVTMEVSDLKCGRKVIPASSVRKYFVRYVLGEAGLGELKNSAALSADRLDPCASLSADACTSRPLWIEIKVPADAEPGLYKGKLSVCCDGASLTLPLQLRVSSNLLPEPSEWAFHLDLWQNPYAVARYFDVPLWSEEHFAKMRPVMETYAAAGGKVITASIIQHPWNSQTYDPFESMIAKCRQLDGSWKYDYSVFDRWVEFALGCGVTEQIDCYTLVPWHYKFDYYDCATNSVKYVECKPQEQAYRELILPFLKDFAAHLKARGWFGKTCIAMDERPMEQMAAALQIVREADPCYRIEGAANYSVDSDEASDIFDMSVAYEYDLLSAEALERRHEAGQKLTFYTCCNPGRPNTFSFSDPAESAFLGWHAAAVGYDGYLRWALNSWTEDPCLDCRYTARNWASGDCYLIYPEGPSIRFERLVEGIQDYEKIRLIRRDGTPAQKAALEAVLSEKFASNAHYNPKKAEESSFDDAAALLAAGKKVLLEIQNK